MTKINKSQTDVESNKAVSIMKKLINDANILKENKAIKLKENQQPVLQLECKSPNHDSMMYYLPQAIDNVVNDLHAGGFILTMAPSIIHSKKLVIEIVRCNECKAMFELLGALDGWRDMMAKELIKKNDELKNKVTTGD